MSSQQNDCDPFADWDDGDDGDGSTGSSAAQLLPRLSSARARPGMAATGAAAQVIGRTPEEIQRRFLQVVTRNLSNAGTASRIARLSDLELAAIARHAGEGAPAERAGLLKLFATRLDTASLVRVARAFGQAPVDAAVRAYADPARRAAFESAVVGLAPAPSPGGGGGGGGGSYPRPNLDMTLEEIYLEFRTAPVGSVGPSAALAETSMYAGGWLLASWTLGTAIGTGIQELISTFDPELDDAVGGTVASLIENMWLAEDAVEQGHYEAAMDYLFGFPRDLE